MSCFFSFGMKSCSGRRSSVCDTHSSPAMASSTAVAVTYRLLVSCSDILVPTTAASALPTVMRSGQHHFSFSLPVLGLVVSSKQSSIVGYPLYSSSPLFCFSSSSNTFIINSWMKFSLFNIHRMFSISFIGQLLITLEKDIYSSDDYMLENHSLQNYKGKREAPSWIGLRVTLTVREKN